jgi:flagellin
MALSILNNISALAAENQLSLTQTSLQKTLAQLSSGQRINSGADDAAGLAIANGLQGAISALTQSSQNAATGTGMLQTADGALSQVTSLLNRAVTIATEAANGTVTQFGALDSEFTNIKNEIDAIGSGTFYNGTKVFNNAALSVFMSDGAHNLSVTTANIPNLSSAQIGLGAAATDTVYASANAAANNTFTVTGPGGATVYKFVAAPAAAGDVQLGGNVGQSLQALVNAINGDSLNTANADVTATLVDNNTIKLTATDASQVGANYTIATTAAGWGFSNGAAGHFSGAGAGVSLSNSGNASSALTAVNTAIANVALYRGQIGASINQVQAATNVMNTQVQNLSQSEDSIMAADIPSAVANMTKYNILQQTGMAALSQSNQMQQAVLKLLQ